MSEVAERLKNYAASVAPERERFAKTGWANYHIWARHPYAEAKQMAKQTKRRRSRNRWRKRNW